MFAKFWTPVPPPSPESMREVAPTIVLPDDVRALLTRRDELNCVGLGIDLRSAESSVEYTEALWNDPLLCRLGFITLDEGNDSNPYGLLTRGVSAGMVLHVFHDDTPKVEFESLDAFVRHLQQLRASNKPLWSEDPVIPVHREQACLAAVIEELGLAEDDETAIGCVLLYLPLLAGDHGRLLQKLSAHPDLYFREALAEVIAMGRLSGSVDVLRVLAEDPERQVRNAALRALNSE